MSNQFYCKSGYYAYIDEVDQTLTGCYAQNTTSSAPLSNITGSPTTTNGSYVVGAKCNVGTHWYLKHCTGGKVADSAANVGKNCNGTSTIAYCTSGSWENNVEVCAQCSDNYVASNDKRSCIYKTTALANCLQANSDGTTCYMCDYYSCMNGTVCVRGAFIKAFAGITLVILAL